MKKLFGRIRRFWRSKEGRKVAACIIVVLLIVIYQAAQDIPVSTDVPQTLPSVLETQQDATSVVQDDAELSIENVPEYAGEAFVILNDNTPHFTQQEKTTETFERYSELDVLGRCGPAYANVCKELMPTEERESISSVKPSGWVNNPYDIVDGRYLYNRCHIIGFQLSGENANKENLITGTRYLNVEGMLPFENMVADYVRETNNHVLYRVTPVFVGEELVARGVQMEAWSVEDEGEGICFNVYCYNVQPGIAIDYMTGDNWLEEGA